MVIQTQDSRVYKTEMTYRYLETNDVHEFRLTGNSRQTINELFKLLMEVYYAAPTGSVRRILIIQVGPAAPMSYFMDGMRGFVSEHRKRAQFVPGRFGVVLEKTPFLHIINQMLRLMRHQDQVLFFNTDEETRAIEWLKQD